MKAVKIIVYTIWGLLIVASVIFLLVCLYGCAIVTVNPKTAQVTTATLFKDVNDVKIEYQSDPNGHIVCKVSGGSHITGSTNAILATIMSATVTIMTHIW